MRREPEEKEREEEVPPRGERHISAVLEMLAVAAAIGLLIGGIDLLLSLLGVDAALGIFRDPGAPARGRFVVPVSIGMVVAFALIALAFARHLWKVGWFRAEPAGHALPEQCSDPPHSERAGGILMFIPALHFSGADTCAQAVALYREALGAELVEPAHGGYADDDLPHDPGLHSDQRDGAALYAELEIAGNRLRICEVQGEVVTGNFCHLHLCFASEDALSAAYGKLKKGGRVPVLLGPQFGPRIVSLLYAEVVDRFGVHWALTTDW